MNVRPERATPVKLTVYYAEPEADPSVFERCVARPEGGFLVVNDLTKTPRVAHLIPADKIDAATAEEIPAESHQPIVGQVDA